MITEQILVAFALGLIIGIVVMGLVVGFCNKEEKDVKNDLISRKDLINYLNLYNYDDTDSIKVKYIRQFLDRK